VFPFTAYNHTILFNLNAKNIKRFAIFHPNFCSFPHRPLPFCQLLIIFCINGREIWPLALRERYALGVFVNKVLRRIFGLNRVDVAGSRINLREMVGGGRYGLHACGS
jgi:hypothetical protein